MPNKPTTPKPCGYVLPADEESMLRCKGLEKGVKQRRHLTKRLTRPRGDREERGWWVTTAYARFGRRRPGGGYGFTRIMGRRLFFGRGDKIKYGIEAPGPGGGRYPMGKRRQALAGQLQVLGRRHLPDAGFK